VKKWRSYYTFYINNSCILVWI